MTPIDILSNKEKRKARRKQTAEDFTPSWLVEDILNKLNEYHTNDPRHTYIDPACGNGNFLVDIVKMKLNLGYKPLDVAKTVFGLDIMSDNITEARFRICCIFDKFSCLSDEVIMEVWKNVIRVEDTLKVDFSKLVFKSKKPNNEVITNIKRKVAEMNKNETKIKCCQQFVKDHFYNNDHIQSIQNIHTPFSLVDSVVKKLGEYTCLTDGKSYLAFNLEFVDSLIGEGVTADKITFVSDSKEKVGFATKVYGVKGIIDDFVSGNVKGGFDVVIGNPPYQSPQETTCKRGGGSTLWDKFVNYGINICKDDGFICMIHPCGWRAPCGKYKDIQEKILKNQIHYLEIHDAKDGLKTFKAGTRYDWYIMQKSLVTKETCILGEDGVTYSENIASLPFIPNALFDDVMKLIAKDGEETVEILHSYSMYESRKEWVSTTKSSKFKYPVVHSVNTKNEITCIWSSENKGIIGTPKVIFGRRQCGIYVDYDGDYGLSQDVRAIVDNKNNLNKIAKSLTNTKFIEIISTCTHSSTAADKYNKDVLSLFRKDFWKDFV